jgi:hypothetical protein
LLFSKLDRAGRETRSAAAADRPTGSMISVRMKSPGYGGFFMEIVRYSPLLVVIL